MVIANTYPNSMAVSFGTSDGTFLEPTYFNFTEADYTPGFIAVADFNNDQSSDLVFVFYDSSTQSFVYSTGAGSFPSAVSTGDVNNDGWIDIIVANSNRDSVSVFSGYHYPTFTINQTIVFDRDSIPDNILVADFNKDSLWDLALIIRQEGYLKITAGTINGTFKVRNEITFWGNGDFETYVIDDLNNDNELDIVIAHSDRMIVKTYLIDSK